MSARKSRPAPRQRSLFQNNASRERLIALFDRAAREENERLGLDTPDGAAERHERLSEELEALNAKRKGYLRQNARGVLSDAELDDLLSELDGRRSRLSFELRRAEDATADARRSLLWAEWLEDPDTLPAWEPPEAFITDGASREQARAAYRRFGVCFELDKDGILVMQMKLPLDRPLADLATTRSSTATSRTSRRRVTGRRTASR